MIIKLISLQARGFKRLDLNEPLVFPEGSLLIYGRNESGKSTILEAIHYALYGTPLRPSKRASVEDILNYGAGIGFVYLKFSINGDTYEVKRTMKRRGASIHELRITRHDGRKEIITGYRNVNKTIIEALNGIDSDALLNSCIVEQKELGKLESSQKRDRINTISTLLNLEAFTIAEEELKNLEKLKREELFGSPEKKGVREEVEEWKKKKEEYEKALKDKKEAELRLNEITKELPEVEEKVKELEFKLNAVSKIKNLSGKIETHKTKLKQAIENVEEAKKAKEDIKQLEKKIATQKKVLEAEEKLNEIEKFVESIEEDNKLIAREKPKVENLKSKLEELKGSDKVIKEKEKQLSDLKNRKEHATRNRILGVGISIGGGIIGTILGILINSSLFAILLISLIIGAYLLKTSKIDEIDSEIENLEKSLIEIGAEKLKFDDYQKNLRDKTEAIENAKARIEKNVKILFKLVGELPDIPSRYKDIFNEAYNKSPLEAKKSLANAIHKNKEELIRMKSKKETLEPVAKDLENRKKKVYELKEKIKKLEDKKIRIERESQVSIEDEEKLMKEFSNMKKKEGELSREKKEKIEVIENCKKIIEENKDAPKKYEDLSALKDSLEQELEVIKRSKKILVSTRDAVFGSVKEKIEANMMKFLPLLTAGRYKAARIDEKEYKIQVYDKEARRWRIKGVFSGATQDQISLALRLAFALSTLPSSRGVVPGFIFLDEPLSGFDEERKKGLLKLLTKGDIAKQFSQIIVISHGEQLRDEFPYKIHLEQGKVVQANI